jgi:membrane associated rhomboid family serine protease
VRPPESWQQARVTLAIAAVTAVAWALAAASGYAGLVATWGGFIPARVSGATANMVLAPLFLTPLTATLIHGGLLHLLLNLLVLLFCGRAVEAIVGPRLFLLLYVVGAYAAAAAQYAAGPHVTAPMVGASGAISAVIGAYAILFGRNRVPVANPRLAVALNALWLAVAWVAIQYLIGLMLSMDGIDVAVAAHVGGFLAGLALARPLFLWHWRKA